MVYVQTNSLEVIRELSVLLPPCDAHAAVRPFTWRIVLDSVAASAPDQPPLSIHRFSHDELCFVSLGRAGFAAFDSRARLGMAFLTSVQLVEHAALRNHFLPALASILDQAG
jgi:hypothetical protein